MTPPPPPAATAAPRYVGSRTTRRSPAPRLPRRMSGPTRRASVALPVPGMPAFGGGLAVRIVIGLRALPDLRLLDRLMRGRGWIIVVGVMLLGIVAMQVSMLKLNAGIGHSVERANTLERQNASLRAQISQLSSTDRIEETAAKLGMMMPPAGSVRYVQVNGKGDAQKAVAQLRSGQAKPGLLAATAPPSDGSVPPAGQDIAVSTDQTAAQDAAVPLDPTVNQTDPASTAAAPMASTPAAAPPATEAPAPTQQPVISAATGGAPAGQ